MEQDATQLHQTTLNVTVVPHVCNCLPCSALELRQRNERPHFRVRVRRIADVHSDIAEGEDDSESKSEGTHKAKCIKHLYTLGPIADSALESHCLPGPRVENTARGKHIEPFVGSGTNSCTDSFPDSTDSEPKEPRLFASPPLQASDQDHSYPLLLSQLAASLPGTRHSPPLKQALLNSENGAENRPVTKHSRITPRRNFGHGNKRPREGLAAQNTLLSTLPAFDTIIWPAAQDEIASITATNGLVVPTVTFVPCNPDGDGGADEEDDNSDGSTTDFETVYLEEENWSPDEGIPCATSDGGEADDEDSNSRLSEEEYTFVNSTG
jgi:hypothetical protein